MGACRISNLEKRSEIYHFGFLYAGIGDLADGTPDYIKQHPQLIYEAKKYLDNLIGFHNFCMGEGHSFNREELDWSFFMKNAIRNRELQFSELPKFKKTLDSALDKLTTSPKARKFIAKIFGNLANRKHAELEEYPLRS